MSSSPIALLGGTFDPVHLGHLRAAWEVREQLQLEEIRLLPAGQPPHRVEQVTGASDRLQMLRLAVAGVPGYAIDERELHRPGPSYMVDTLAEVRSESGSRPVCLAMGQDSALTLESWFHWTELFEWAHLVIMQRPGRLQEYPEAVADVFAQRRATRVEELHSRPAGLVWNITVTQLDISSSAIRSQVRSGRSPRFLVPDPVAEYIDEHGLYRSP